MDDCIFCKFSKSIPLDGQKQSDDQHQQSGNETPEYFFADNELFVIEDIKPRAPHHYLVITREHIESAKSLTNQHLDLVRRMVQVGGQVLKDRYKDGEVKLDEIKLGFHWPPMTLIKHLHMHVFYPASEMSFVMRNVVFRPNFFFITPDWLMERLKSMQNSDATGQEQNQSK